MAKEKTKKERAEQRSKEFKQELASRPEPSRVKKNSTLGIFCEKKVDVAEIIEKDEFFLDEDPNHNFFCKEDIPDDGIDIEGFVDEQLCCYREEPCCKKIAKGRIVTSFGNPSKGEPVDAPYFIGAATVTQDEIVVLGLNQVFHCFIEAAEEFVETAIARPNAERIGLKRAHALTH